MASFADWFRTTREKRKLTQTQAAEQLKLSSPTISRWEAGTEPRAGHLLRICEWGPVKADKLLQMISESNPQT